MSRGAWMFKFSSILIQAVLDGCNSEGQEGCFSSFDALRKETGALGKVKLSCRPLGAPPQKLYDSCVYVVYGAGLRSNRDMHEPLTMIVILQPPRLCHHHPVYIILRVPGCNAQGSGM